MQIIAGLHKGKKLFYPKTGMIRPTSGRMRGSIFNICQLTIENAQFLDLFSGIGAMGLEALSRGANHCTFVDIDPIACRHIEKNVEKLGEQDRSHIVHMDVFQALSFLQQKKVQFDIIFADPPYGKFLSNRVLSFLESSSLLKEGGELFLEDDTGAEKENLALKNLSLKSSRSVGRTLLRHYML